MIYVGRRCIKVTTRLQQCGEMRVPMHVTYLRDSEQPVESFEVLEFWINPMLSKRMDHVEQMFLCGQARAQLSKEIQACKQK